MPSRPEPPTRRRARRLAGWAVLAQVAVYGACMAAYFWVVLMALGNGLKRLADQRPALYAILALGFIVVQSTLLEALSNALQRSLRRRLR